MEVVLLVPPHSARFRYKFPELVAYPSKKCKIFFTMKETTYILHAWQISLNTKRSRSSSATQTESAAKEGEMVVKVVKVEHKA